MWRYYPQQVLGRSFCVVFSFGPSGVGLKKEKIFDHGWVQSLCFQSFCL